MESMKQALERAMQTAKQNSDKRAKIHRFDIFKGMEGDDGRIQKLRSIGSAQLMEGAKTYTVYLKPLLGSVFYLLPEEKRLTRGDYVILTREPSMTPGRKYFWNNIGECFVLGEGNSGIMRLEFDLFGAKDIYMSLHPICRGNVEEVSEQEAA
ncbi:MAG TPA: hypothetical protein VJB59_02965 [Bdellovibrionota bacterium]|nr:hypothetical protein [Bdellovibrionota bacterium]